MPDFPRKLTAQPVSQRAQPGGEHFYDVLVCKHPSAFPFLVTVYARTQRLNWHAMVHTMIRQDNGGDRKRLLAATCFWC